MFSTVVSVIATRGVGGIAQAILLIILVREFGPLDFGKYTLVSTIAGFGMAIFGFGLNTFALRIGVKSDPVAWGNQITKLRNLTMLGVSGLTLLCLWLFNFEGMDIAILAVLFVVFETSSGTVEAVLFGLQRTKSAQSNLVVRRALVLLITFTGLLLGLSIVQSNGLALIVATLVSGFWTKSLWGSRVPMVQVFREATSYWIPSILSKLGSLDIIVARASMPQLAFGVFSAGTRVVSTFQLLPNAFLSVFTPHLTKAPSPDVRYRLTLRTLKMALIGGAALLLLSPIGAQAIVIAAGPGYPDLFSVSILLIFAFAMSCINQVFCAHFYAEARPIVVTISSLISIAIGMIAIWKFSEFWDSQGAALGTVLLQLVQLIILGIFFRLARGRAQERNP